MALERTFVLVKPDGVQRALVGTIVHRFEGRGLKIVAAKLIRVSEEQADQYYAEHEGKPFFQGLVEYVTSGPSFAMILEGEGAVANVRSMIGATDPTKAQSGTIRGDMGLTIARNLIHGADSLDSARREISIFFSDDEVQEYQRVDEHWLSDG